MKTRESRADKKKWKAHTRRRFRKGDLELTTLAIPSFVWYICFSYLPMFGIIIAFVSFKFQPGQSFFANLVTSPWSGLKNFEFLFSSNSAWIILRNTLGYNLLFIVLNVLVPTVLAIMISQLRSKKIAKTTQTFMFLPYFMSWVVVAYFVEAFLNYDFGFLNTVRDSMGMGKELWYLQPSIWPSLLIILNIWKSMGYGMVVYLAAISGIDGTLYEAALIDGASKWQRIRFITLPMLKVTMIMMFLLSVGRIFYSDFGLFYQVPKGSASLFEVTETLDVYIWRALGQTTNISMPSAAAFVQSAAGCLTILLSNWIVRKVDKDSAIM
ncbi:MAG: ABC transporter permease subunit [Oscillospiraceae bacterium]|nr:ABC transporter permease subunit [Oscillospiraceae bacterium]